MPINAINDTGVKYLYDKLHGEIEPVAEAVSDSEVTIEGNPLSFNTLSSQNAKSTILSCEPIQDLHGYDKPWVGGAGKNKFDVSQHSSDFSLNNTILSNANTDSKTAFQLWVQQFNNGTKVRTLIELSPKGTPEIFSAYFTISGDITHLRIKHNGTARDLIIAEIPFTKTGTYCISMNLLACNPSVVNGLQIKDIQIEEGETATSYEPYSNICPISGRTEIGILGKGKNLLPMTVEGIKSANPNRTWTGNSTVIDSITFTILTDRDGNVTGIKGNGIATGDAQLHLKKAIGLSSGDYIINGAISSSKRMFFYDGTSWYNDNGSGKNFTISSQTTQEVAIVVVNGTSVSNEVFYPMIRLSTETDANFEPYTKSTDLTINLGQTVYGGTLDVENGVLVVDRAIVDLGDYNYSYSSNWGGYPVFFCTSALPNYKSVSVDDNPNAICSEFEGVSRSRLVNNDISAFCTPSDNKITIRDNRYSDATTFKTAMQGVQLCYELVTPITINLTPHTINLLKGANNISTDGDKITLTYRDGSVATLGDLTSAVDELDSKIDESKILTDTATGDKYILVVTNGVLDIQQISN